MIPFKVDLSDKIVAVTGGGGVLMSEFARALAACGVKQMAQKEKEARKKQENLFDR